jgi:hypothetical protein
VRLCIRRRGASIDPSTRSLGLAAKELSLRAAPRLGGEAISECGSGDSAAALTVARRGRSLLLRNPSSRARRSDLLPRPPVVIASRRRSDLFPRPPAVIASRRRSDLFPRPPAVIASRRRSDLPPRRLGDCFVATLLAMTRARVFSILSGASAPWVYSQ